MRSPQVSWKIVAIAAAVLLVGGIVGFGVGSLFKRPPPAPEVTYVPPPQPVPPEQAPPPVETAPPQAVVEAEPPPPGEGADPHIAGQPVPALPEVTLPPDAARPELPWRKNAVPAPATSGKPVIAIVIDDLGLDRKRADKVVALPGPLTLAFMAYAHDLARQTGAARARGHELLVHTPMEAMGKFDEGPNALTTDLSPDEIRRRFREDIASFAGHVGVNNHMGSKFTAWAPGMAVVMQELHDQGLMFLDSVTTGQSVGPQEALKHGVPFAVRNVFLDNDMSEAAVAQQLAHTEQVARKSGAAIAIGHPHDGTIAALQKWLPTVADKGFVLVPVTAIVNRSKTAG